MDTSNTNSGTNKDRFEMKCPAHNTEVIYICVTNTCGNQDYICKICSPEASCIKNQHEIVLASSNKIYEKINHAFSYDYKKIRTLTSEVEKINIPTLKSQFSDMKQTLIERSNQRLEAMRQNIKQKIDAFGLKASNEMERIKTQAIALESGETELIGKNLPESMNIEEIKKLIEKAISNNQLNKQSFINEIESIIGMIKKYLDNEKVTVMYKEMENLVYCQGLCDKNLTLDKTFSERIEILIKILEEEFKELKTNSIEPRQSSVISIMSNITLFDSNPCVPKKEVIISDKCQKSYTIDSVFCSFVTYDSTSYIAFANQTYTVDLYNLSQSKIVQSMKNHTQHIFIVRHFFYKGNSTDYLLSTGYDKKVNIWKYNLKNKIFDLQISINTGHAGLYLYSGLILFDESQKDKELDEKTYIITSVPNEQMKVFNMKGTLLKHIGNKTDYSYFINSHFDSKSNSYHILNANSSDVKIISFKDGNTIRSFKDSVVAWHMSAFISELDKKTHLFESDGNGWLRIWEYDTAIMVKKILTSNNCNLRGIVLWNENYVIAASSDKTYKVIDIKEDKVAYSQACHENVLCTVQKLIHPIHGEVIFTCAIDGKLKMWI